MIRHTLIPPLLTLATLLLAAPAAAQSARSDDNRLRLDPGIDRRATVQERAAIDGTEPPDRITIDGQVYTVANNPDDLGRALYLSVARKNWADVRRFLPRYRALPRPDPMLVAWALGGLARSEGRLGEAERQYRALLAIQPDFLPGRLELGRVLFEDRQDREAKRLFRAIRDQLAGQGAQAAGVRKTVDTFLAVLDRRSGWQGMIAFGPGYGSNLNQSSASQTCLLTGDNGVCLIDRTLPPAIASVGLNVEGNISRRIALKGHGGLLARAFVYGDVWPKQGGFNQATLSAQIGYDHQTARRSLTLSPTFDLSSFGNRLLFTAPGLRAEAMVTPSPATALRLELARRVFHYRRDFADLDGPLTEASLTGWLSRPGGWTLLAGLEAGDKGAGALANAYRHMGARLGVVHGFGDWAELSLIGSVRQRDYRAYSELLAARRHDRETNLTAVLRLPKLRLAGLTPNILLQHNRVKSNVDWLYSFRRTAASIRLEHAF
ncbi:porin family protein [Sphingomonas sp. GM_Shp_1]|uniref:porin family protein n=1 Tax=Sphingomonas sp. GM_Shp_1 TaxID=2937381 RepID=UPI00226B58DC|nr:porin family protein [Sphingomonas sp. GM_Shp_1]